MKSKLRQTCRLLSGFLILMALLISTKGNAQLNNSVPRGREAAVEIGTGTETSGYIPVSPYYGYSFSQTLYLQSEINVSNQMISQIGYQYRGESTELELHLEVYVSHTTATTLNETQQLDTHTKVFDGQVFFSNVDEYTMIDVDQYYYNNSDNLIVTIIEKKPGWDSPADVFNVTSTGENIMSRYARNDQTAYNPGSLPDSYGELNRANIRIEFVDVPTTPAITVIPTSLDFGQVELTQSNTLQATVKNSGGGVLTISNATISNSNFTITGATFPVNLTIGQSQIFDIVFTPTNPALEEGTLTFVTDASVPGNKVIDLTGRGLRFGVLRESFENEMFPPLGWKVVDLDGDNKTWFRNLTNAPTGQTVPRTGVAAAGLPPYAGNVNEIAYDDWLITPQMVWNDGDLFSFWVKRLANQANQVWKVGYSVTGNDPSDFTIIDQITDPEMTYTQMSYDLSEHGVANGQFYYMAIQFNGKWSWPGVVDDVLGSPLNKKDKDLMMFQMTPSTQLGFQDDAIDFSVDYANYGFDDIAAGVYQVQICANIDGTETILGQIAGEAIEAGELSTAVVPVTFTSTGIYNVYAKLLWSADEDQVNNFSPLSTIEIFSPTIEIVNIGTFPLNNPTQSAYYPINFTDSWINKSLSQTMYLKTEINTGGIIERLSYYRSFPDNLPQRKIKIWIGETSQTSLNTFVPASQMQLVFDGKLDFNAGNGRYDIDLTNPYVYTGGGNLVITVYYYDGNTYSSGARWSVMDPDSYINRTAYESWNGSFDPENPTQLGYVTQYPYTTLLFETGSGLGSITGIVRYQSNNQPADGALVEITNPEFPDVVARTFTNSSGEYSLPYAMAGNNLTITISKYGYNDYTYAEVNLAANGNLNMGTALLETRPQVAVTGSVLKSDTQTAAANATVTIVGDDTYVATTNASGQFSFPSVWGNDSYEIEIELSGYQTYNSTITVPGTAYTVPPITILEVTPVPNLVNVIDAGGNAHITWYAAGEPYPITFRYDDGVARGVLITPGTPEIVGGSAWKYNAEVQTVQWYTYESENYASSDEVMLTILGLNPDGSPNPSDVLFTAPNVSNNLEWNTYTLPTPVEAPNGFFFGISGYNNYTLLAYDDGVGEPYEFTPRTQWSNGLGSYNPLENATSPPLHGNIFVRAAGLTSGEPLDGMKSTGSYLVEVNHPHATRATGENPVYDYNSGELYTTFELESPLVTICREAEINVPESENRAFQHYNVYRRISSETDWTKINTYPVVGISYLDNTFSSLSYGIYQYAVDAEYSNGVLSPKSVSNYIEKDMRLALQLTVNNNTGIQTLSEGAQIVLQQIGGYETYSSIANESGLASFTGILKGNYNLYVEHVGFIDFIQENVNLDMPENSYSLSITIEERIDEPFDYEVLTEGQQLGQALFIWNQEPFTDNLEAQTAFAIDNLENWTMFDQDGKATNYPAAVSFPHLGEPMSFIVMNRTMTNPPLSEAYWGARSGNQYLAGFASLDGNTANWIISEEQNHTRPFTFSFYARSITETYGLETFQVGYSTTGTATSDFTFTTGSVTTGIYWQQYSYVIPAEAKYVAIKHNYTGFALLIDDLSVGIHTDGAIPGQGYNVFLDGDLVAEGVDVNNYMFTDLNPGIYTAGLQGVFHTGTSDLYEIEFTLPEGTPVEFNIVDENNAPVDNALVEVLYQSNVIFSAFTSGGAANLTLYPGSYSYRITKEGYAEVTGSFIVASNPLTFDVTINMIKSVIFEVTDDENNAIQDALITVNSVVESTDANGTAEFDLEPGTYQYTVTKPGYNRILQEVTVNQDMTIDLTMSAFECGTPQNLASNVNGNTVNLVWEAPVINFNDDWLHWDGDYDNNSVGTGGPVDFDVAQRFEPIDLTSFDNHFITRVAFVPKEANCEYSIKIWTGGSIAGPETLIIEQAVANPVIGAWNEVILNSPVYINPDIELWIGVRCNTTTGHPAGVDAGPHVNGKGNMINLANQGWQTLIEAAPNLTFNWSIRGFAEPADGSREYTEPLLVTGFNIYRDDVKINTNPVINNFYNDTEVAIGEYDYYVTALWNDGCESGASNEVNVSVTTLNCPVPQDLTAILGENNQVTVSWDPEENTEFRYDDNVRTGQLGFQSGTINGVLGAAHDTPAVLTEMSWLLSDAPDGGGPHETIQLYIFGLKADGTPNSADLLYTASVGNTDGIWNVHELPAPINTPDGFFLGVAYEGFAGLGTDDGIGDPYIYQNNTHYFIGDYNSGTWSKWEASGFAVNGMIRAIGTEGAVKSYAVDYDGRLSASGISSSVDRNSGIETAQLVGSQLSEPVVAGEPQWNNRSSMDFSGYNLYKDGELLVANLQTNTYQYTETASGEHCYTATGVYTECESEPSNEACITISGDCPVPQDLTAEVDERVVTISWDPETSTEFRYDDNVRTAQLGFQTGTIAGVVGAAHNTPATITEMSWLLSDAPDGGGPHDVIQIYIIGLNPDGSPNSNDVLFTESVNNTDGIWNVYELENPVNAPNGFFLGVAYNGFVGLGTDDGIGEPYIYQNGTHYYAGDYTTGTWSKWEDSGFPYNGMIRAIGTEGAVKSFAVIADNELPNHQPSDEFAKISLSYLDAPVVAKEPLWYGKAPSNFQGYNLYKNGILLAENLQTNSYQYTENANGTHCYTATGVYTDCESQHSNEACVTLVGINEHNLDELLIYPNPASTLLNIEGKNISTIIVYNTLGQPVLTPVSPDTNHAIIDISDLSSGLYLVRIIENTGFVKTIQVIKK